MADVEKLKSLSVDICARAISGEKDEKKLAEWKGYTGLINDCSATVLDLLKNESRSFCPAAGYADDKALVDCFVTEAPNWAGSDKISSWNLWRAALTVATERVVAKLDKKSNPSFEATAGVEVATAQMNTEVAESDETRTGFVGSASVGGKIIYKPSEDLMLSVSADFLGPFNSGITYQSGTPYMPSDTSEAGASGMLTGGAGRVSFEFQKDDSEENKGAEDANLTTLSANAGIVDARVRNDDVIADRGHRRGADLTAGAGKVLGAGATVSHIIDREIGEYKDEEQGKIIKDTSSTTTIEATAVAGVNYEQTIGNKFGTKDDKGVPYGTGVMAKGTVKYAKSKKEEKKLKDADEAHLSTLQGSAGYSHSIIPDTELVHREDKHNVAATVSATGWFSSLFHWGVEAYLQKTHIGWRAGGYAGIGLTLFENGDLTLSAGGNGGKRPVSIGGNPDGALQVAEGDSFGIIKDSFPERALDALLTFKYDIDLKPITLTPSLFCSVGDAGYKNDTGIDWVCGAGLEVKLESNN